MSPIQPLLVLSTEGRTGERRPIQTACLGFLYSVLEESFETNPKGLKEKKDVRKCFVLLYFDVGFTCDGNRGGFLQKRHCHCSSYSRNHDSYVLEKPRTTTHYLTLEEVGNWDRSVTNFFHAVRFDLWCSYDVTCILLGKGTDAARRLKGDMPPDRHTPSWCLAPALWSDAAPH